VTVLDYFVNEMHTLVTTVSINRSIILTIIDRLLVAALPAGAAATDADDVSDDERKESICECHAWNSVPALQSARGRRARLRLAC